MAASGPWPGAGAGAPRFRLIVVGDSDFATNAYFPADSNGVLAVPMIRWLAGDQSGPAARPRTYAEPQVVLTNYQMKVIFAVVEVVLINIFDRTNLIRPPTGIGVFQSAYGPRLAVYNGLTVPLRPF
ncbi:MAG: hypothetical protein M1336_01090 [Deltaproteobacteria bacterium]|nr:hypothetical protein [Deltaproteobacteria bacterium]